MYEQVQKRSSEWNATSTQKSNQYGPSSFSVQRQSNKKSNLPQARREYSTAAREALAAKIMRTLAADGLREEAAPKQISESVLNSDAPATTETGVIQQQQESGSGNVMLPIQAKLTIGEPGDKYEQEADRVAEQVMQMKLPTKANATTIMPLAQKPSTSVQTQSKGSGAQPKGKTNFKGENKTYPVTATTLQEAADQFSQRDEAGETIWNPKFNLKTDDSDNVTEATVDVTITVTLPTWSGSAKLSKAAKAEWNRALKALKEHEENHVKLVRNKLKDVAKSLIGKTKVEAEEAFQTALDDLKQASDDYDTSSDHGRNEGTVIDASVETPPSVQPSLQRMPSINIQAQ